MAGGPVGHDAVGGAGPSIVAPPAPGGKASPRQDATGLVPAHPAATLPDVGYRDTLSRIMSSDFTGASSKEKETASRDVIELCSYACAGLALQPIPGLEQAILPLQVGMVLAIAHIHGQELGKKKASAILFDLAAITGVSVIGRQALLTVAKFALPFVGGLLGAPYVFSVTWGTGYAALHYLRSGGKADSARIRKIFEEERSRGKEQYRPERAEKAAPDDD